MSRIRISAITFSAVATLALAGCSGSTPEDTSSPTTAAPTTSAPTSDQPPANPAGGNRGHVTVTVDGDTWDFPDSLNCVTGYDNTRSDVYSFVADAKATFGEANVQFQLSVRDESGQNRLSGDGVKYEITLQDYKNYDDPAVDVEVSGTKNVAIVGTSVTADGKFTNIMQETHTVKIDGVCAG